MARHHYVNEVLYDTTHFSHRTRMQMCVEVIPHLFSNDDAVMRSTMLLHSMPYLGIDCKAHFSLMEHEAIEAILLI